VTHVFISQSVGSLMATHVANSRKVGARSAAGLESGCSPKRGECQLAIANEHGSHSHAVYRDDEQRGHEHRGNASAVIRSGRV
jgi:hypothetical protein